MQRELRSPVLVSVLDAEPAEAVLHRWIAAGRAAALEASEPSVDDSDPTAPAYLVDLTARGRPVARGFIPVLELIVVHAAGRARLAARLPRARMEMWIGGPAAIPPTMEIPGPPGAPLLLLGEHADAAWPATLASRTIWRSASRDEDLRGALGRALSCLGAAP